VAKVQKIKKEKKDALANIDINNIAGKTFSQNFLGCFGFIVYKIAGPYE